MDVAILITLVVLVVLHALLVIALYRVLWSLGNGLETAAQAAGNVRSITGDLARVAGRLANE